MKIYILNYVDTLTYNYHCGGGLAVIAESIEDAKNVVSTDPYIKVRNEEWETAEAYDIVATEKRYWVFPDAGCC